jgi:hypothetical protein
MPVRLSDKFPRFNEKILSSIKSNPPIWGSRYRFIAFDGKDVGTSFEPRVKVDYEVYVNKQLHGTYSSTFVFEKNLDFVTTVHSGWIAKKS